MAVGVYRTGTADEYATVDYSKTLRVDITRTKYEAGGHVPPYDTLPTKAQYEASGRKK